MSPGSFPQKGGLYLLAGALLLGVLWQGAYFPLPGTVFALALLAAGSWEAAADLRSRRPAGLMSPALWLLASFTAVAAVGLEWTVSPADTRRGLLLLTGYMAVLFITRSQMARDSRQALMNISQWLVYVATFAAVWGIGTWIFRLAPYAAEVDGLLRAGSTLEYSNALACLMLMALPVTLSLMFLAPDRERPVYALAATLQAAASLLSLSRSGVVLLLAVAVVALLSAHRRGLSLPVALVFAFSLLLAAVSMAAAFGRQPAAGTVAVTALTGLCLAVQVYWQRFAGGKAPLPVAPVAGALLAALLLGLAVAALLPGDDAWQPLTDRFSQGMEVGSLLPHRLDTAAAGLEAFRERPWRGWGLGSFDEAYWRYSSASFTRFAHNLPLQAAVETGVTGALAMTAFLVYAVQLAIRRLLGPSPLLVRAMAAAALVFIVYNLFDWEWYLPALTAWFMVMVGCMEGNPKPVPKTGTGPPPEKRDKQRR